MDHERIRDDESLKNYKELKNKLELMLGKVKKTTDLREAKGYLIEIQNCFKGLKLQREDREELFNRLQTAFADINQKISDERMNFENEAASNYFIIKNKVEEAVYMAHNCKDSKECWNFLIEVQSLFKGVKLQREHRETLYTKLQGAFNTLKEIQNAEATTFVEETIQNYEELKQSVHQAVVFAINAEDTRAAKDVLINAQAHLRDAKLSREQKDELYANLQDAFTTINIRKEEETEKNTALAQIQYEEYSPKVKEVLIQAEESTDFKIVREELKDLQTKLRESSLLREQRIELQTLLQQAFEKLNSRQDSERNSFTKEASDNYKRLKALVSKGLSQAEETHEYKDTREFLKKIQSEFKGIKMIKEEREELYARLQTAFEILNARVDEYFHTKKKNWEVRMQYKLAETNTEIHQLRNSIEKDLENLSELEDHLDIVISSGKDSTAKTGIEARIISARSGIEKKTREIEKLETEMFELKNRINPEENNED
ncbi:MAG: hypothetical protein HXX18_12335 [Bacteroidetes bacterium]|nr:hypothetical protein [Bacteroidota bacterium]